MLWRVNGDLMNGVLSGESNDIVTQLVRYVFVGGIAFLFDFGALFFLTSNLHLHYLLSAAIAFILGLTVNYTLSIMWVFGKRTMKRKWMEFLFFALIGVVGLGLNEVFMWLLTEIACVHYLLSKIGSAVLVFLWNFFCRRVVLFN
jgi:putative flippase GtrA